MRTKTLVLMLTIMLTITITGCAVFNTLPILTGVPENTKYVEVNGQTATLFKVPQVTGNIWMDFTFAIVPQVEIPVSTKLNIYDNKNGTLTIVINGQDKQVDAQLYRLGPSGFSVAEGWHWQHDLAILERLMDKAADNG